MIEERPGCSKDAETYTYGWMLPAYIFISLILVCFTSVVFVRAAEAYRPGDWIYFVSVIPGLLLGVLAALAICRDVLVSVEGIGRSAFGLTLRFVHWDEIVEVYCSDVVTYGSKTERYYHFRTRLGNPLAGVLVKSTVADAERLIGLINTEVVKRGVRIVTRGKGAPVVLDELPGPFDRPGSLRAW